MIQKGKIVETEKKVARIQLYSTPECSGCGVKLICKGDHIIEAINEIGAKRGDTVEIEVEEGRSLKIGVLTFLAPVAVFMGVFVGSRGVFKGEGVPFLCSLVGVVIFFLLLHKIDKKLKTEKKWLPKIIRIIEK